MIIMANSLADQQQVYFRRIDQINVWESVHPFQPRVDPTVQLNTNIHKLTHMFTQINSGQVNIYTYSSIRVSD